MNSVATDIKDKLVTAGIGEFAAATGWSIHISSEPPTPDTTITLYDTGGPPPEGVQDRSKKPLRFGSILIRVRGDGYGSAHTKIKEVYDAIVGFGKFTVSAVDSGDLDVHYKGVFPTSEILFLEQDGDDRYIWVVNFQARREEK